MSLDGKGNSGADRIRTCGTSFPVHRFSKPALSTTQPPLRSHRESEVPTCGGSDFGDSVQCSCGEIVWDESIFDNPLGGKESRIS